MRSYLLKEDFQFFWGYRSPYWAGRFLDRWCTRTMRSKIGPMKRVARMLRGHRPLILNWFRAKGQLSSSVVDEGFNAKAKLTTRKAYGFRGWKSLCIIHLAPYPSRSLPTDFPEEALIISSMGRGATQGSPMVFPVRLLSCTGNTG